MVCLRMTMSWRSNCFYKKSTAETAGERYAEFLLNLRSITDLLDSNYSIQDVVSALRPPYGETSGDTEFPGLGPPASLCYVVIDLLFSFVHRNEAWC